MAFWHQILRRLNFRRPEGLSVDVDAATAQELEALAQREQRPPEAVARDLLRQALVQRRRAEVSLQRWEKLSPREQQVAALVCLNYTNRQIAVLLGLSPQTIKTHVANVLTKFDLKTKLDLRQALADWDFGAWEKLGTEQ